METFEWHLKNYPKSKCQIMMRYMIWIVSLVDRSAFRRPRSWRLLSEDQPRLVLLVRVVGTGYEEIMNFKISKHFILLCKSLCIGVYLWFLHITQLFARKFKAEHPAVRGLLDYSINKMFSVIANKQISAFRGKAEINVFSFINSNTRFTFGVCVYQCDFSELSQR